MIRYLGPNNECQQQYEKPCVPGGKYNPHCCMHNPHLNEMESWKHPILVEVVKRKTRNGNYISREIEMSTTIRFVNAPDRDWETIALYVNLVANCGGIVVDDTSNSLSELAIKILQAEKDHMLTLINQTATCVTGACGYTTLHEVMAGYHPELVKLDKTNT